MSKDQTTLRLKFSVQADRIIEFASVLEQEELENTILGKDEDEEDAILVSIEYEEDDKPAIYKLLEITQSEYVDDPEEEEEE